MNKSTVLIFNFSEEKLKMLKMVCMMMGIRFKIIPKENYLQPIGALFAIEGIEMNDKIYTGEEFSEEMMLLCNFNSEKLQKFLQGTQRLGVGKIDLKALLTEHNKTWSPIEIFAELNKERAEFKKLEAERKAAKNNKK